MSLLHKAEDILNSETKSNQILIILFPGKKSLLFKSILDKFSNQIERDKPNLNTYLLNIDDGFTCLRNLIQQIINTTDLKKKKLIKTIMIWPALLLPGTFQRQPLEAIIREYNAIGNIYLIEPLDFEQEIYPFLLKTLEIKLHL